MKSIPEKLVVVGLLFLKRSYFTIHCRTRVNGRLEEGYTLTDIKSAIENYKTVLSSPEYFFTYRWTLKEFLQRDSGFSKFLPTADPLNNYRDRSKPEIKPVNNIRPIQFDDWQMEAQRRREDENGCKCADTSKH